jgi:RHS repeat-associated protein
VAGIGLYNYKARYYDPYITHFISADNIDPKSPGELNRYAYVMNNPIIRIDPSGHDCQNVDMSGHIQEVCAPGTKAPVAPSGSKSLFSDCDLNAWACKKVDLTNLDKPIRDAWGSIYNSAMPHAQEAAETFDIVSFELEYLEKLKIIEVSPLIGPAIAGTGQGLDDMGQGHSLGQETARITFSILEDAATTAIAAAAAFSVIAAGGGPENAYADAVGIIAFAAFYAQTEKSFNRANFEVVYPLIEYYIP